ncbi:MAG: response regulator [Phenylobacterium sp.]|uniref:response regulator n=1 Tax=Phenylobacterium sp. TaxID=1871053 RepID=UPI00120A02E5|nr:response regulator [Phenylobacterium sp.]TAL29033.1 MAG: response regulator [Phenylobacterium sp.]
MILIVEDNLYLRRLWLSVLDRAGHAAHGAASGGEAIAAAIEILPDLVITDLDLPDMNGFDLIAELRPLGSFPIVAVTGATDLGSLAHLGFAETVIKPIATTDMVALVDRHLHTNGGPAA